VQQNAMVDEAIIVSAMANWANTPGDVIGFIGVRGDTVSGDSNGFGSGWPAGGSLFCMKL